MPASRSSSHNQAFSRTDRVRKAMIREIGDILSNELRMPDLEGVLISVTDAEVSGDLRHVKVFLSILGDADMQTHVMARLNELAPRLRSAVGRRIQLRHTPELHLVNDDGLARGSRITQLLNEIATESEPAPENNDPSELDAP
ncbi:MAG: 30S ribosome-binding factor RbfA [Vampirovibrionales bacterium]|nr:30S ribosome-binding factor RbfA [Vampirovibrionales bacterium]